MLTPDTPDGLFHEGNPGTGQKGTKVTAEFMNGLLDLLTGRGPGVRTVVVSGPVLETDGIILVDASAGPVVLSLLSAASSSARVLIIIKVDAGDNPVTLQAAAGQTLPTSEGRQQSADLTMQDESIRIMPNGVSHWHRIG